MRRFLCELRDELTGVAEHRREVRRIADQVSVVVLRDAVSRIRRFYLPQPPSGSSEYDRGYGDAILDVTRLLSADPPRDGSSTKGKS
jgi:hypothetical protein